MEIVVSMEKSRNYIEIIYNLLQSPQVELVVDM